MVVTPMHPSGEAESAGSSGTSRKTRRQYMAGPTTRRTQLTVSVLIENVLVLSLFGFMITQT